MLTVSNLTMRFGGIVALTEVAFTVTTGSITALIGPNGAGKTTAFNCITGFYPPTRGEITLHPPGGAPIDLVELLGNPATQTWSNPAIWGRNLRLRLFGGSHLVARAGIARTFQNIRLFREMTVMENLLVAQHLGVNRNPLAGVLRTVGYRRAEARAVATAASWLRRCDLLPVANRIAGELPYGQQRRLEIARAMCTSPHLLCLDEPAAGLNPNETREVKQLIRSLRGEFGVTVLLIEHDMGLVMDISDQVVVLDHGVVIASGEPAAIRNNPKVLEAYLGTETE